MEPVFIQIEGQENKSLRLTKPGIYVAFFHNISGELTFDIAGSGIRLEIIGLYTALTDESYILSTIQRHSAPGSSSNLLVKGVFAGNSKLRYRGLIRIEKAASKTKAYQKNQNMLMTGSATVDTKPDLEILANDVICTHGSTIGRPDRDSLYFVQSRGMDMENANAIIMNGFIEETLQNLVSFGLETEASRIRNYVSLPYV